MIDLLPHQKIDGEAMARERHGLNYSKPGTGKTLTTLNAVDHSGVAKTLVLAPPIALTMWANEAQNFSGCRAAILRGGRDKIEGRPDFVVTTYALAAGSQREALDHYFAQGDHGTALILDEAHNVKNREAKRTKAVFGPACTGKRGLFALFDAVWSLTGTPIIRHADDMWAQLRATHPDALRAYGVESYERFVSAFCIQQLKQHHPRQRPKLEVTGSKNEATLRKLIYDDCRAIRRSMDEVKSDMPPLTTRVLEVNNVETRRLTKAMKESEAAIEAGLTQQDEGITRAWREIGMAKLADIASYVEESVASSPVLVGYWFTEFGVELAANLTARGLRVSIVNGATPSTKRDAIRDAFNSGELDCIVGQLSAMNTAWNIQEEAAHVVVAEDHFSPGIIEQFYKRVYRFGQKRHVQLDFVKVPDHPIEKAVTRVRERKQVSVDKIHG